MVTNCSLLNFCFIFYILSMWYNTFVTSSDEFENINSEHSDSQNALSPMQMEVLQKWNINVDIENLINITNQYIESPTKMTTKLFRMILGKQLLYNMTIRTKKNSCLTYNPIPENVKNFIFEYVNQNAKSGIDNSTFFNTVIKLCGYIRSIKRDQFLRKEHDGTLTRLQEQLLQKWGIDVNKKILIYITRKYNDRPKVMITELLKMILGDNFLDSIPIGNMSVTYIKDKLIPKNVQDFILEYVNLHTKSNIDRKSLIETIRYKIKHLRKNLKNTIITTDALPDFSMDELRMHGIEIQDADLDMSNSLEPDNFT